MNHRPCFDLIIFDMDGTLTVDALNFDELRRRLGIVIREPVLEWIAELPEPQRTTAWETLHKFEYDGALASDLRPGARTALYRLQSRGVRTALLSRNSRRSVEVILQRHELGFDMVCSRDDPPMKPDPESIWRIARQLAVELDRVLMVGDYIFDLQAARAAGVKSALLLEAGAGLPHFAADADYHIRALDDMVELIEYPDRFEYRIEKSA